MREETVLSGKQTGRRGRKKRGAAPRMEKEKRRRGGKRTLPLDAAGESINLFANDNSNLVPFLSFLLLFSSRFSCHSSDWNIDRSCARVIISLVSDINCVANSCHSPCLLSLSLLSLPLSLFKLQFRYRKCNVINYDISVKS